MNINDNGLDLDESKLLATKKDSLFREQIESKDRFPLSDVNEDRAKNVFFAPLEIVAVVVGTFLSVIYMMILE